MKPESMITTCVSRGGCHRDLMQILHSEPHWPIPKKSPHVTQAIAKIRTKRTSSDLEIVVVKVVVQIIIVVVEIIVIEVIVFVKIIIVVDVFFVII